MNNSNPAVLYQVREDGIHEITFLESSTRAVDELIIYSERRINENPPDVVLKVMVDNTRTQSLPPHYAYKRVSQLIQRYPERQKSRVAFILNGGFLTSIVDTFLVMLRLRKEEVRCFDAHRREEAVAWLLREQVPPHS